MNSYVIIGMATMLTLALVAAMTTTTAAYATTDANFAGQVTSRAAQEGGSDFGAHASDPGGPDPEDGPSNVGCGDDPGRCGLSQALTGRGNPQHPSEVIDEICTTIAPGSPGCSED